MSWAAPHAWAAAAVPEPLAEGVYCDGGDAAAGGVIAFAGWTVHAAWAWHWLQALEDTGSLALAPQALRCVVRGPQDSSFKRKDIDTAALAGRLGAAVAPDRRAPALTVIAHSSGAYVAHHWLRQLPANWWPRIRYYNLDGDIGVEERELDRALIQALASVTAVYASDGQGGESANADRMRALHALDPQRVCLRELRAEDGVCAAGARWCLHEVLITQRPHDATGFDLARDYGRIGPGRPVQDGYLHARCAQGQQPTPGPR